LTNNTDAEIAEEMQIVGKAMPSTGSSGKTGSWRTEMPVIDYEKCTKCDTCVMLCVENVISKDTERKPVIDYEYCKGCGVCADVCPVKAISMVKNNPEGNKQ